MTELDELRTQVRRLIDQDEIANLLWEYSAAMDGQDPKRFALLLTDDVVTERAGGDWIGREQVMAGVTKAITRHFSSHHMITNYRMAFRGEQARTVCYFHSVHLEDGARPDEHEDHGGWYLIEFRRTGEGWKMCRRKQVSVWSGGTRKVTGPLDPAILDEMRGYLSFSEDPTLPHGSVS